MNIIFKSQGSIPDTVYQTALALPADQALDPNFKKPNSKDLKTASDTFKKYCCNTAYVTGASILTAIVAHALLQQHSPPQSTSLQPLNYNDSLLNQSSNISVINSSTYIPSLDIHAYEAFNRVLKPVYPIAKFYSLESLFKGVVNRDKIPLYTSNITIDLIKDHQCASFAQCAKDQYQTSIESKEPKSYLLESAEKAWDSTSLSSLWFVKCLTLPYRYPMTTYAALASIHSGINRVRLQRKAHLFQINTAMQEIVQKLKPDVDPLIIGDSFNTLKEGLDANSGSQLSEWIQQQLNTASSDEVLVQIKQLITKLTIYINPESNPDIREADLKSSIGEWLKVKFMYQPDISAEELLATFPKHH